MRDWRWISLRAMPDPTNPQQRKPTFEEWVPAQGRLLSAALKRWWKRDFKPLKRGFKWWLGALVVLTFLYWGFLLLHIHTRDWSIVGVAVLAVIYSAGFLVVLRNTYPASVKVVHSLLVLTVFVGTFSYVDGEAAHKSRECFGYAPSGKTQTVTAVRVDPRDAIYFTIGTLTTAGTGSLVPTSESCRALVSIQMVFGFVLIGIGVSGVASAITESARRK
jgi:hypothetical protein